jgi:hypothetical protein
MKIYNKILSLALAATISAGALTSCDYLDIDPENSVPEESVDYTNIQEMYEPVSGAYARLRTGGMHWVINMLTVIRDGDVWSGRIDDQADMVNIGESYRYNNAFWAFNEMWNQYYGMIKTCNSALESLDQYAENITDEATMKTYRSYCGEVRILRAYAYYRLTQGFGDVTILRSNSQTDLTRSTRDAVYRYMLNEDLEYAINNCADAHPNQMEHQGAFTKYTAAALAAKVYLNMGNYAKVEELTNMIINSGKFSLYPDYYQLFKYPGKLCSESLMECQCTDFGMGSGDQITVDCFFLCCGPTITSQTTGRSVGGWNFVGYQDSFQQWAANRGETVRATTSFLRGGEVTPSGDLVSMPSNTANTDCWNGKWYVPMDQILDGRTEYGSTNNVRIIRYAEVLLMNAEALVRQGKNGDAPLNLVRQRAQMPNITNASINDILDERRMELCCEWGERYNDLIRCDLAQQVLGSKGWSESVKYYPLPANQLVDVPALYNEPYDE